MEKYVVVGSQIMTELPTGDGGSMYLSGSAPVNFTLQHWTRGTDQAKVGTLQNFIMTLFINRTKVSSSATLFVHLLLYWEPTHNIIKMSIIYLELEEGTHNKCVHFRFLFTICIA